MSIMCLFEMFVNNVVACTLICFANVQMKNLMFKCSTCTSFCIGLYAMGRLHIDYLICVYSIMATYTFA